MGSVPHPFFNNLSLLLHFSIRDLHLGTDTRNKGKLCYSEGRLTTRVRGGYMENSLLWKAKFIPVYFIVALLNVVLFKFYIQTDNITVYYISAFCVAMGIASIIYNAKFRHKS